MKEKILFLIIGVLIGAIITTGVFLMLDAGNTKENLPNAEEFKIRQMDNFNDKNGMNRTGKQKKFFNENSNSEENAQQQTGDTPPELPNGEAPNGNPPELPNGKTPNNTPSELQNSNA